MADTGFKSPSDTLSVNWVNPTNIFSSDDNRATYNFDVEAEPSTVLSALNFGLGLPVGAVINGIEVTVERSDSDQDDEQQDNSAQLIVGGSPAGDDKSKLDFYGTTDAVVTYGGPSDLWGLSPTFSQINASNFGFGISVKDEFEDETTRIDHIQIKVYYTEASVIQRVSQVRSIVVNKDEIITY